VYIRSTGTRTSCRLQTSTRTLRLAAGRSYSAHTGTLAYCVMQTDPHKLDQLTDQDIVECRLPDGSESLSKDSSEAATSPTVVAGEVALPDIPWRVLSETISR
jgi:hypothetical protein